MQAHLALILANHASSGYVLREDSAFIISLGEEYEVVLKFTVSALIL